MSAQNKIAIATKEAPAAIGPYTQAIRVGDTLFASGQIGLDPATGAIVEGGIEAQTRRVLENVKAVLGEAGLDLVHVVKTTVYVASANRSDLVDVWCVVRDAFGDHDPPSTLVGVTALGYDDQLVEVAAVAAVPASVGE